MYERSVTMVKKEHINDESEQSVTFEHPAEIVMRWRPYVAFGRAFAEKDSGRLIYNSDDRKPEIANSSELGSLKWSGFGLKNTVLETFGF